MSGRYPRWERGTATQALPVQFRVNSELATEEHRIINNNGVHNKSQGGTESTPVTWYSRGYSERQAAAKGTNRSRTLHKRY